MVKHKQINDFMWKEMWPALSDVMDPQENLKTSKEINASWMWETLAYTLKFPLEDVLRFKQKETFTPKS